VADDGGLRRAAGLERPWARRAASWVRVEVGDARARRSGPGVDRVLLDPPCSGLGTLQSRPDIRWRASPQSIAELVALQRQMLAAAAAATAAGGALVYSVCTISRAEGAQLIEQFLATHSDFRAEQRVQLLPHRDLTDGFFIAELRRSAVPRRAGRDEGPRRGAR